MPLFPGGKSVKPAMAVRADPQAALLARHAAMLVGLVLLAVGFWLAGRGRWFPLYSVTQMLGFPHRAMLGGILVLLGARPPRAVAFSGIALLAAGELATELSGGAIMGVAMPPGLLGGAGVLVAALAWAAMSANPRRALAVAVRALLLPAFVVDTCFSLDLNAYLHPATLDGHLFAADSQLGFLASAIAEGVFARVPALAAVCGAVYIGLPLMLLLVASLPERERLGGEPDFFTEALALGACGYCLYHLVPVCGPAYAFDPGSRVGAPLPIPIAPNAWRNAVPSLHTAWALCIAWQARRRGKWVHTAGLAFLGLTLLATLGLGEHYLTDLAVAVPFAAAVRLGLMRRWPTFAACAGMTLGWLALLRSSLVLISWPPGVMLALILVSFVLPVMIERNQTAQVSTRLTLDPAHGSE